MHRRLDEERLRTLENHPMTFIRTIPEPSADGAVREVYQVAQSRVGFLPNWARAFSLRPDVWLAWDKMHAAIRASQSLRAYELATLAAARALHSSYCSLAHGKVLADKVFDAAGVTAIMANSPDAPLTPGEQAMMAFAEKVAVSADRITAEDVDGLRKLGFDDEAIFDIAATAAARCFFSKLLDALGVQPDARFARLDDSLRESLQVGRTIASSEE